MVRLVVLLLGIAVAAYPWITDAILQRYLGSFGIEIGSREAGYGGIHWSNITWSGTGVEMRASSVTAPSILTLAGYHGGLSRPITVDDLLIVISAGNPDTPESGDNIGMTGVTGTLFEIFPYLERYLPSVEVDGISVVAGDEETVVIREAEWRAGHLVFMGGSWERRLPAKWEEITILPTLEELRFGRHGSKFILNGTFSSGERLSARMDLKAGENASGRLSLAWDDGDLQALADWTDRGWLPMHSSLESRGTTLPGLHIEAFTTLEPSYSIVAAYNRPTDAFSIKLDCEGHYLAKEKKQQPVPWSVSMQASGDPDNILVTGMDFDLPGLKAVLDRQLELNRSDLSPTDRVCMRWNLDLAKLSLPDWSGTAEGVVCLMPLADRTGSMFSLAGSAFQLNIPDFIWPDTIDEVSFQSEGSLDKSALSAESLNVHAQDLVRANGRLTWDLDFGMVDSLVLEGTLLRHFIKRWIGEDQFLTPDDGMAFLIQGRHTGSAYRHSGKVEARGAVINNDWSADLQIAWEGLDQSISTWEMDIKRDTLSLFSKGSLEWDADAMDVNISAFKQQLDSREPWILMQPTRILRKLSDEDDIPEWMLEPVKLSGPGDGNISIEGKWSAMSDFRFSGEVRNVSLRELQPWIGQSQWSTATIGTCTFTMESLAGTSGGYNLIGRGRIQGDWVSIRGIHCVANGQWFVEKNRSGFQDLSIQLDGVEWLQVDGVVPVSLYGDNQSVVRLDVGPEESMMIQIQFKPVDAIPAIIAEKLPVAFDEFSAKLTASGTLAHPRANIDATSKKLSWKSTTNHFFDSVMDLSVAAEVGVDSLTIDHFSLRLPESDKIESITGNITGINWIQLIENPGSYSWNELAWSAQVRDWPVATLGSVMPQSFLPKGSFSIELSKESGINPTGYLTFEDLSWRAPDAGLFARDISGTAELNGFRLEDLNVRASIGGGAAEVNGWMDFEDWKQPLFSLRLKSSRIDLVRRSDLILRGQAHLQALRTDPYELPILKGDVELIRSLWLRDLLDFTRQGVTSVARRPPYFSVAVQPFAEWRLDVAIHGLNFLKLQSALLRGTASAELQLGGTMAEPILVGNASLNEGSILFPFANLKSSGMQAWIAEDDPYSLKLAGSGEGVVYGYLVQYQLSGTSEAPSIQFNAIPSLAQHEILLMLTTGAIPSVDASTNVSDRTRRVGLFLGKDYFSNLIGTEGASRLEVRTGEGFSPFRREGEVLEYKVNNKWSVIGEYDDFGSYNVDLRRILLQR